MKTYTMPSKLWLELKHIVMQINGISYDQTGDKMVDDYITAQYGIVPLNGEGIHLWDYEIADEKKFSLFLIIYG